MKNLFAKYHLIIVVVLAMFLSSCEAIGDIFQGGMWVGAILVIAVVGLLIYFLGGRGRRG